MSNDLDSKDAYVQQNEKSVDDVLIKHRYDPDKVNPGRNVPEFLSDNSRKLISDLAITLGLDPEKIQEQAREDIEAFSRNTASAEQLGRIEEALNLDRGYFKREADEGLDRADVFTPRDQLTEDDKKRLDAELNDLFKLVFGTSDTSDLPSPSLRFIGVPKEFQTRFADTQRVDRISRHSKWPTSYEIGFKVKMTPKFLLKVGLVAVGLAALTLIKRRHNRG